MSNNEWVQEGTPRDDAEWTEEADDYGVPVEPAEWDDYSDEQAMPVPPRPVQPEPEPEPEGEEAVEVAVENQPTAPDPDEVLAAEDEPVVVEEPGLEEEQVESEQVESEQASVFDDAQPVEAADEDLTREVAEGIEAELVAEEPVADDPEDSVFGSYKADEPAVDEPAEEVAVDEPAVDEDSLEETALVDQIDDEPTDVRTAEFFGRPADAPVFEADAPVVPVPAAAAAPAALAGLYRAESDETQVLDTTAERRSIEQEAAEEEARAAALRAEKEERDRRLGMVQTSNANAERELRPQRRGVGGFGSFGLFILRLVTAAILGIVAYQVLYSIDATSEFLAKHPLIPEPRLVSWIVGFTLAAMAVMLVIGLGVRIVGFLLVAIAGLSLAFIRWGNFSPFLDNMEGFIGDKDLLLAAIGILFFSIGGGRFGIDGAISRSRAEAREAKRA